MNNKHNDESTQGNTEPTGQSDPKKRLRSTTLTVEVDLEAREVFFNENLCRKLKLDFDTTNMDRLISDYVDPLDVMHVNEGLKMAQEGRESPIRFRLIHPRTLEKLCFEYRYEIVYVKYASTRLNGVLVSLTES